MCIANIVIFHNYTAKISLMSFKNIAFGLISNFLLFFSQRFTVLNDLRCEEEGLYSSE